MTERIDLIKSSIKKYSDQIHVVVLFGASVHHSLNSRWLFRDELLPKETYFIGYARSNLTVDKVKSQCEKYMKCTSETSKRFDDFWSKNFYQQGQYSTPDDFRALNAFIEKKWGRDINRIYYFATPPSVYEPIIENLHKHCLPDANSKSWVRLIIEKPFGRDLASSNELSQFLSERFTEKQVYRIDHYLGKEMVQNLIVLRFANQIFAPLWDREHIDNVTITFKENIGTEGRGGYFDQFGIIRDVVQNHLMQILCLVAMEKPNSMHADDIREEKVRVLRNVKPIKMEDVVLGQYVANSTASPPVPGYTDDPTVDKDSITPTYSCIVLYVNNDRWSGVPFILRAGKALNEQKAEVRIQFKSVPVNIFPEGSVSRNELVIRVQPGEAVYVKLNTKSPGMRFVPETTELDLTYSGRYHDIKLPDAYERLILDVFLGSQTNFVRKDELEEAWRVLTPILDHLESNKVKPLPYVFGSRDGPEEAKQLQRRSGFVYSGTYQWTPRSSIS